MNEEKGLPGNDDTFEDSAVDGMTRNSSRKPGQHSGLMKGMKLMDHPRTATSR